MTPFGTTRSGKEVAAVTLADHGLSVTILTYGGIVQSVRLDGVAYDLTVGSNELADYETDMPYHGALIGPVANRIRGATARVAGQVCRFDPNQNGQHTLHGGGAGTHSKVWDIDEVSSNALKLSHSMPHGQNGFPTNRHITAEFEIAAGPTLRLTLTTQSDGDGIANVTNHSYWNLDGTGHMRDHSVRISADQYLPTDGETIPTGVIAMVQGTPFDMRQPTPLQAGDPPLDTTFCLSDARRSLTEVLTLTGASGLSMTMATTETGVLIYDGRPAYDSIAIEAQGWPDAPNQSHFPEVNVTPDAPVVQTTQWRFNR